MSFCISGNDFQENRAFMVRAMPAVIDRRPNWVLKTHSENALGIDLVWLSQDFVQQRSQVEFVGKLMNQVSFLFVDSQHDLPDVSTAFVASFADQDQFGDHRFAK